nr:YopX family protein [Lysinibacillus sphaericus]
MSREIKFRAWLKGRMVYITPDDDYFIDGDGRLVKIEQIENGCNYQGFEDYECNLMQYTGLKDKNGKEIYEGDIVSGWKDSHWHDGKDRVLKEVEWTDELAGFNIIQIEMRTCEVIGNIYEHSHLL